MSQLVLTHWQDKAFPGGKLRHHRILLINKQDNSNSSFFPLEMEILQRSHSQKQSVYFCDSFLPTFIKKKIYICQVIKARSDYRATTSLHC